MKKIFLLLGLALSLTEAVHAQSVHLGIKAGASLTNYTGKGNDSTNYKFGFHAGFIANIAVNDVFSSARGTLFHEGHKE